MTASIQSIRGMHDLVPAELPAWQRLESVVRDVFGRYGYSEIRVPVLEMSELFARAIGAATDVVEKEMYTFEDRNGDVLTLRPEGTAGVVRAVLQNGLLAGSPLRLWYAGPMFRRERPQKGRTRQFHQVGAEVFGAPGPDVDAELLAMCRRTWTELGIDGLRLEINSLGTPEERGSYRNVLHEYFSGCRSALDEDSLRRLERNPLRILDSKNPDLQAVISGAPVLAEFLGVSSRAHFDGLCQLLDELGLEYRINPRLVRGLDYYSHAVFEWVTDRLGAQGTVCAGGRYDTLVEIQGGKPCPGVGFAIGLERVVELMRMAAEFAPPFPHAYLVMVGEQAGSRGMVLAESLRESIPELRLVANLDGGSFKSQLRRADRSGAGVALILGEDEVLQGTVSVKRLRGAGGQERVQLDQVVHWLRDWLAQA